MRTTYQSQSHSKLLHTPASSAAWPSAACSVPRRACARILQPAIRKLVNRRALNGSGNDNGSSTAGRSRAVPGTDGEALVNSTVEQNSQPRLAAARVNPQKRTGSREIDVDRAIQLLKVTTQRSRSRSGKLPPWFTRTQDPDVWDGSEQSYSLDVEDNTSKPSSAANSNSTSQSAQPAENILPLDSYMALDAASSPAESWPSDTSSNGVQGNNKYASQNAEGNSRGISPMRAASSPNRSRMFSASDPIRMSTTGQNGAASSPWVWQGAGNTDAAKEQERQFRRAVFSFDRWAAHRSTSRYLRHFRGIFTSRTFQGLLQPMSFFTGMAVACGLYNLYGVPAGAPEIVISSTPLDITAFAVSLLLVFRTDSSYARWEEALKTWNEVRSLSKDLARQSCYWVNEPARKAMLVRWCEAFSRALLVHCRVEGNLEHELEDVLLPHEVAAVAAVGPSGAPSFVLQVLAELIEQCGVTETKEDTMFCTVRSLSDSVAVCNKLLRYPLPLAYTRHTSRFMFLWLSIMPWAMWSDMHWACVPVTAAISYLLLGIDEIGVQIEEPFGILPLEDVCVDITAEIDAMMERQDIVTDLLAAGGVDCVPRSTCGECGQPVVTPAVPAAAAAAAAAAGSGTSSSSNGSSSTGGGGSQTVCVLVPAAPTGNYKGEVWLADNSTSSSGSSSAEQQATPGTGKASDTNSNSTHGANSSSWQRAECSAAAAAPFVAAGLAVGDVAVQEQSSSSSSSEAASQQRLAVLQSEDLAHNPLCLDVSTSSNKRRSRAHKRKTSSSSSSSSRSVAIDISSSARSGVGAISRIGRSGSPQGLVARWVTSTITASADSSVDALSSLEDAIAPGFDVRGLGLDLSDLGIEKPSDQNQDQISGSTNATRSSQQQQQGVQGEGISDVVSSAANDSSSSSSSSGDGVQAKGTSSNVGRLGWYDRQPAPNDDQTYPD